MDKAQERPITLYRCYYCSYLWAEDILYNKKHKGVCKCSSMKFRGGVPVSLIEKIKCRWWAYTLKPLE